MRYANTETLDFDSKLAKKLKSIEKSNLIRLFNTFAEEIDPEKFDGEPVQAFDEESVKDRDDFVRIIASDLPDQARRFLQDYETLKENNIQTKPAIQYLSQEGLLPAEKLGFRSRIDLLLGLYEQGLVNQIDEIAAGIDIRKNEWKRTFTLDTELDVQGVEKGLKTFHQNWNQDEDDPVPVRAICESKTENELILKLYQEKQSGSTSVKTFDFRLSSEPEIPAHPKPERVPIYELKELRFSVKIKDNQTEIVFADSKSTWNTTLNAFFDSVFGVEEVADKLERYSAEEAEEFEEELESSVEEDSEEEKDPLASARSQIEERQKEILPKIDGLSIPDEEKVELKECIQSIQIGGSDIADDPSIATDEFRLVGELQSLFDSVDISTGFKDILEKADPDKRAFVIKVNGKSLALRDGQWQKLDPGSLGDTERQALEYFFGDIS